MSLWDELRAHPGWVAFAKQQYAKRSDLERRLFDLAKVSSDPLVRAVAFQIQTIDDALNLPVEEDR